MRKRIRKKDWQALAALAGSALFIAAGGLELLTQAAVQRDATWAAGKAQLLCVGSSHVIAGVDPARMDTPTGVIAYGLMDLQMANTVLLEHEDQWPDLRAVLIELDDFTTLTDTSLTIGKSKHLLGRLRLSVWDVQFQHDSSEQLAWRWRRWIVGEGSPGLYSENRLSLSNVGQWILGGNHLLVPTPGAKEETPWFRRERRPEDLTDVAQRRAAEADSQPGDPRRNLAALEQLVERLHARGVAVGLISFPLHQAYRDARTPAHEQWITAGVQRARAIAGPDVPHWDYRADERFVDADFVDADHLSAQGQAKLTGLLTEKVAGWLGDPRGH